MSRPLAPGASASFLRDGLTRSDRSLIAEWRQTIDPLILVSALLLLGGGVMASLAAGPAGAAREQLSNAYGFTLRHGVFALAAALTMMTVSLARPVDIKRFGLALFVVASLLTAGLVLVGTTVQGSARWLRLPMGFQLQPSELLKPSLVIVVAMALAAKAGRPRFPGIWLSLGLLGAGAGLLALQPDYGQTALLAVVVGALLMAGGAPWRLLAGMAGAGAAGLVVLYFTVEYVQRRINAFFGWEGAKADDLQINRSLDAISHGGLIGVGPGEGEVKYQLPDAHSDFVFAVIGEELGLVGLLGIVAVFAALCLGGLARARRLVDPFARFAASGLLLLVGVQAMIHMLVNVQLAPTKGMTLPFISYGGSSMIGIALTLGAVLALTRKRALAYSPSPSDLDRVA